MTLNPDQYRLPDTEHRAIFENRITPHIFAGASPVDKPVAVIFGGQPGAGKSMTVDAAVKELAQLGGAVQIIGDEFRNYHKHYDRLMDRNDKTAAFYTDRDTGKWVEMAIAHSKELRVNIVIEGTMRDGNKVAETMLSLRDAGYVIDARALAVNERFSNQGIIQRYENQKADRGNGRMTTPEAHAAALAGMSPTLERIEREKLADRVTLYRRGGVAIYSNELRNGEWATEPNARTVLEAEQNRPMTLQERRIYAEGFDKLAELLAKPERKATAEESKSVEDLRQRAKRELLAEVFRQEPEDKAIQQFPELAPAYDSLRATDAKAAADGKPDALRSLAMAKVRDIVAGRIARGYVPSVKIDEKQVKIERHPDQER